MKLHCPQCKQLLEAEDSMSGQVIQCPACSGDLRIPAVIESKALSREARPDPRPEATAKSSNPGSTRAEDPPETWLSESGINKPSSRSYHLKSQDEEGIEIHQTPARSNAPGSVSSLVLGIISISLALVVGFFVGLFLAFSNDYEVIVFHFASLVVGMLAIIQAEKAKRAIQSSSGHYSGGGMATAGMTCGIIGIGIFLFLLLAMLSLS